MNKYKTVFIVIALTFALFGCSKPKDDNPVAPSVNPTAVPTAAPTAISTFQVYYTATGPNGASVSIGYTRPDGNSVSNMETLPYTSPTMTFSQGSLAMISAAYLPSSLNQITVNIYKDGTLFKTNTSQGVVQLYGSL
jgi:hypothetical protein